MGGSLLNVLRWHTIVQPVHGGPACGMFFGRQLVQPDEFTTLAQPSFPPDPVQTYGAQQLGQPAQENTLDKVRLNRQRCPTCLRSTLPKVFVRQGCQPRPPEDGWTTPKA